MSSWELVSQLFWMPFDIMTRISRQFFLLGRNVLGSLFGTRPAIKPPPASPPPSISPIPSSHVPLVNASRNSVATATVSVPSCVIGITGTESTLEACTSSTSVNRLEQLSETTKSTSTKRQKPGNNNERASVSTADKNLHVEAAHAESIAEPEPTKTIEPIEVKKRLRDKEKRKAVTSMEKKLKIAEEDGKATKTEQLGTDCSSVVPPQSKKPKLLEEEPMPSVSSAVATNNSNNPSSKNKKKRTKKRNNPGEEIGIQGGVKMGRSSPPNYLIAVQVSNKDITCKVENLQKLLSEKKLTPPWHGLTTTQVFKDAMVPVAKLHFTLHVMHLEGQQQIEKAQSAFKECCSEIEHQFIDNPLDLTIEGLGHFKNSVLFAQIKDQVQVTRLTELATHFRNRFDQINVWGDPRPFKPHLTIAKTSRSNKLYKMKIRAFPPDIWSDLEEINFGTQRVNSVQLLRMAGKDKVTGYYHCLTQHDFYDNLVNNPSISVPLIGITTPSTSSQDNDSASSEKKEPEPVEIPA